MNSARPTDLSDTAIVRRRLRADQMTDFFCENLARYLSGKPLLNLVDKRLGFPCRASS